MVGPPSGAEVSRPFAAIEEVISHDELVALSDGYKRIAGYSKEALRG